MGIGNIANTGMNAALTNMESISNNIANANTYGFKRSVVDFADVFPSSYGSSANAITGLGVQVTGTEQDFSNGDLDITTGATDFSIGNSCFFIMKDPSSGQVSYTRYGGFIVDNNGYLTYNGGRLQGFQAVGGVIIGGGSTGDLQINTTPVPAQASTTISFGNLNLNADDVAPVNPFDADDPTTYNHMTPTTIYDSLGNANTVNVYFIKTTDNNWNVQVGVNGDIITTSPGTLIFNDNGTLNSSSGLTGLSFEPPSGAASPQTFGLNLTQATQFALDDKDGIMSQDGFQAGTLTDYQFDQNGNLTLIYSNNQRILAGQIALASFPSVAGLQDIGAMSWQATSASGNPVISTSNSTGVIQAGTLELSNVDLTQEMVNLVGAQQTFQANAQVEQVYNDVMKTVIQL